MRKHIEPYPGAGAALPFLIPLARPRRVVRFIQKARPIVAGKDGLPAAKPVIAPNKAPPGNWAVEPA